MEDQLIYAELGLEKNWRKKTKKPLPYVDRSPWAHLDEFVGVLHEDLGVLLHLSLIPGLGRLYQYLERDVGLQERVAHVVHHRLTQL